MRIKVLISTTIVAVHILRKCYVSAFFNVAFSTLEFWSCIFQPAFPVELVVQRITVIKLGVNNGGGSGTGC